MKDRITESKLTEADVAALRAAIERTYQGPRIPEMSVVPQRVRHFLRTDLVAALVALAFLFGWLGGSWR